MDAGQIALFIIIIGIAGFVVGGILLWVLSIIAEGYRH